MLTIDWLLSLEWGMGVGLWHWIEVVVLVHLKATPRTTQHKKAKKKKKKKKTMLGSGLSQVDDVVYLYSLHCAKPTKQ